MSLLIDLIEQLIGGKIQPSPPSHAQRQREYIERKRNGDPRIKSGPKADPATRKPNKQSVREYYERNREMLREKNRVRYVKRRHEMLIRHAEITVSEEFSHYKSDDGEVFQRTRELFNGKVLIERAIHTHNDEWLKFAHYADRPCGKPIEGKWFRKYIECFATEVMKHL